MLEIATAVCYVLSISTVARACTSHSHSTSFRIRITVSIFRTYFMQWMSEQQCRAIRYTFPEMRYGRHHRRRRRHHHRSTFGSGMWQRQKYVYICVGDGGIHFYYYFAFRISRDTQQELRHHRFSFGSAVVAVFILYYSHSFSFFYSFIFGVFFHLLRRTAAHFRIAIRCGVTKCGHEKLPASTQSDRWQKNGNISIWFCSVFENQILTTMTLFTCKCDDAAQSFRRFVARTENRKNIQILLPVEFAMDKSLKERKNKYFIYFFSFRCDSFFVRRCRKRFECHLRGCHCRKSFSYTRNK